MFEKLMLWGVILLLTIGIILLIKKQIISKRAMVATTAVGGGAVGSYALYSAMGKILLPAILLILVLVAVVVVMAKTGKGSGSGGGIFGGGLFGRRRDARKPLRDIGGRLNRAFDKWTRRDWKTTWENKDKSIFRRHKDKETWIVLVGDDGNLYTYEAIPGFDYDQLDKVETEDTITFYNPDGEIELTYKKDESHLDIPDETDPTGKIIFV